MSILRCQGWDKIWSLLNVPWIGQLPSVEVESNYNVVVVGGTNCLWSLGL